MAYVWSTSTRRYRGPSGRFIPDGQALRSLEKDLAGLVTTTDQLAAEYRAGRLSLEAWRMEMQDIIKHVAIGSATLAKGGRAQMTPADFGRVGQRVREQYGFLEDWVQQIVSGEAPLDGRLTSRARLYVAAGRPTYVAVRAADVEDAGFDQEHSETRPAEHCDQCLIEEARGWVPIGTLIPIGQRTCKVNDHCLMHYRNSRTGETVAA